MDEFTSRHCTLLTLLSPESLCDFTSHRVHWPWLGLMPPAMALLMRRWIEGLLFSPIGGVANVCRPTSWAGPRPSRKSLNWASEESLTPGKMRLKEGKTPGLPQRCWHETEKTSAAHWKSWGFGIVTAMSPHIRLFALYVQTAPRRMSMQELIDWWICISLLSLGAVAVHAAVRGLPAGLPSHPAPHLHRQARLRTPLDRAA